DLLPTGRRRHIAKNGEPSPRGMIATYGDGPVKHPPRRDADFEVGVVQYVWRMWRAPLLGEAGGELGGGAVHSIAPCERDGTAAVRVEWSSTRQTGRPVHVYEKTISATGPAGPGDIGDTIVYGMWAKAHGTS